MIHSIEALLPGHIRIFANRSTVGLAEDCWEWTGSRDKDGYGFAKAKDSTGRRVHVGAHRIAYLLAAGSMDPAAVLDHLCRNRACCNPAHLEPVTNGENVRRGNLVNRETCRSGRHPWGPGSFRVVSGRRVCLGCESDSSRRYYIRKKATMVGTAP